MLPATSSVHLGTPSRPPPPQDISAQLAKTPWQEMVVLQQYCGPRGTPPSGPHGAQPLRLQVSPLALAMMDLHAHMDRWAMAALAAAVLAM